MMRAASLDRREALGSIYRIEVYIAYNPWIMALKSGSAKWNLPPPCHQNEYLHTCFISYVSKSKECHKKQRECGDRPVCGKC